jgi:hypothetical protein
MVRRQRGRNVRGEAIAPVALLKTITTGPADVEAEKTPVGFYLASHNTGTVNRIECLSTAFASLGRFPASCRSPVDGSVRERTGARANKP